MQNDITWGKFELNNLDKTHSFENLCRLLFKHEFCPVGTVLYSKINHPGIEVEPVVSINGKMISFQSKYFSNKINYEEIKNSADKTVKYYSGKLDAWYLYCNLPVDKTCPSFEKISSLLNENGIEIVAVVNDEILTTVLKYPYIMDAFFNMKTLPISWFKSQVNNAVDDLGIRYNKVFNVETEALNNMDLFVGNKRGIDVINGRKKAVLDSIIEHCNHLSISDGADYDYIEKVFSLVSELPDVGMMDYVKAVKWYSDIEKSIYNEKNRIAEKIKKIEKDEHKDNDKNYLKELYWEKDITNDLKFNKNEIRLIKNNVVMVSGRAGTGKSQLFASEALDNVNDSCEAILLLGEYFINDSYISEQIIKKLFLDCNLKECFALLERYGQIQNRNIVIFIDAINECEHKKIWKNGIMDIYNQVKDYERLRIAISYREEYKSILLSDGVKVKIDKGEIATIIHCGFNGNFTEAIKAFFNYYKVPFSPIYIMQERLQNPLFLSIFCKTYQDENKVLSFPRVFEHFIEHADDEVKQRLNINLDGRLLFDFLQQIIRKSIETGKRYIKKETILELNFWSKYGLNGRKLDYLFAVEKSGILNTFCDDKIEYYDLGYDLLRDFMYADLIKQDYSDIRKLKKYIEKDLLQIKNGRICNYGNESVFIALLGMLNEEDNTELLKLMDELENAYDKTNLIERYMESFSWRDNSSLKQEFIINFVNHYEVAVDAFIRILLENSLRTDSMLNAYFMYSVFMPMSLSVRDGQWTKFVNRLYDENERLYQLIELLEINLETCAELRDSECELMLILFGWVLTSSNRTLRDHTSKVIYNILYTHSNKVVWFIKQFADANDPYIVDRILCICLGVIARVKDKNISKDMAEIVYNKFFSCTEVIPDVLIREYAYLIIVKCINNAGNIEGVNLSNVRPPYKSDDIVNVTKQVYKSDDYGSGLNRIIRSMKPDKIPNRRGFYGDFGRYVFETCLDQFKDVNIEDCYHYAIQYIRDELGYTNEEFSDYDNRGFHLNYYPGQAVNIERIGKKYQWIALRHIIAKISDNHLIRKYDQDNDFGTFEGTWELYDLRDYDPTITKYYVDTKKILPKFEHQEVNYNFNDDSDEEKVRSWVNSKEGFLGFCEKSIIMTDLNGCKWIKLYIFEKQSSEKFTLRRGYLTSIKGDRYSWFQGQAFFAKKDDRELLAEKIKNTNYWGHWFPRENSETKIMRGEYPWSPACSYIRKHEWKRAYEVNNIVNSKQLAQINIMNATIYATWEAEYDASIEEINSVESIPCLKLMEDLQLTELNGNGCFYNPDGKLIAYDNILTGKENELIIRLESLKEFLNKNGFCVFWTLLGENKYYYDTDSQEWSEWSGYAILEDDAVNSEIYNITLSNKYH